MRTRGLYYLQQYPNNYLLITESGETMMIRAQYFPRRITEDDLIPAPGLAYYPKMRPEMRVTEQEYWIYRGYKLDLIGASEEYRRLIVPEEPAAESEYMPSKKYMPCQSVSGLWCAMNDVPFDSYEEAEEWMIRYRGVLKGASAEGYRIDEVWD